MKNSGVAIVGMGMITAVGLDAAHTAASIRAGMSRLSETSIMDKRFEPMVMSILPEDVLPPLRPELEDNVHLPSSQIRMIKLAASALSEAVPNLPGIDQMPLYLGVPQQTPDRPGMMDKKFIKYLSFQCDLPFDTATSILFPNGRAAGLMALGQAINAIATGAMPYVIVGGVDTYVDLYRLGTLDMENRISGPGVMDGFIPGEAGAFMVVGRMDQARSDGLTPLAMLTTVSQGHEPGHMYSDQPYRGDGLANAVTQLFDTSANGSPVQEVFISMNGENHWAKEWGVSHMRNQKYFSPDHGFHHPADCIGDTGAASGPVMVNLAAMGLSKQYLRNPILVICSSDHGERAVVGVTTP